MSDSNNNEKQYINEIKAFVESPAWVEFALPAIQQAVQKELPKPTEKGWEEKYRYAYALSEAIAFLVNTLSNIGSRDEFIHKIQQQYDRLTID